jgi:hypothetical protein
MLVDTVPGVLDLLVTNGEFVGRWASTDSVGVEITGRSTGRVSLNNCAFWGPLDRAIWSHAPDGNLAVNACGFVYWDIGALDSPAIQIDGGKAIVQGSLFSLEAIDVRVGKDADSVILTGNQAPIGLRVENEAGAKVQSMANEADTLQWPPRARRHYTVNFGEKGDSRYVRGFQSRERARPWGGEGTMRWGGATPRLVLPVEPHREYVVELDVYVPEQAAGETNGLYLGDRRIAEFPGQGTGVVHAIIPPQKGDTLELSLRGATWREDSKWDSPNSGRPLTVGVRRLTMKAERAPERAFNANSGGGGE